MLSLLTACPAIANPTRLIAALIASAVALIAAAPSVQAQHNVAQTELARAEPGAILRIWPLGGGVPSNYKGYRVLYRSTGVRGEPVAVTGAVMFPPGGENRDRDVVAWAHPTTGVVSRCAPTLLPDIANSVQGIDTLIARGYVIVATDYIGLGTGDTHPYLIGDAAARSVIDSVRAARNLRDTHAGKRFAVWGHSQGGQAALFTGALATAYAPELKLVGVAAAAPATDLAALFNADRATSSGRSLSSMALLSWSRTFGLPLDDFLAKGARHAFEALASDCIESISDALKEMRDEQSLERQYLQIDPTAYPATRTIMQQNSAGPLMRGVPLFLAQGAADDIVRPEITRRYMRARCREGTPVKLDFLAGVGHINIARDSAYEAVDWITRRFQGEQAPSDC